MNAKDAVSICLFLDRSSLQFGANNEVVWLQTLLLGGANPTTNSSVIPPEVIQKALTGVTVANGVS